MTQITTYIGIDAHKKDLFVAMLVGPQGTPVTWPVAERAEAVRRLGAEAGAGAPGPRAACATKPARAAMRCSDR